MAYSIFGWIYVLAESVASYHRSTCQWETDYPKESSLGFYSYPEVCALQHQHAAPFFGYASIVLFMDFPLSNKIFAFSKVNSESSCKCYGKVSSRMPTTIIWSLMILFFRSP